MSVALQRYPIFDVASPLQDLLFYEVVDYNIKSNRDAEYGMPHHDKTKYPNHVLVFIMPADKEGKTYRFYYAAKRENQDEYNFQFSPTTIGGITTYSVIRTYIILRSEFNESDYVIGSEMPNIPEGKFTGNYKLFSIEQKKSDIQELDSMFVVVQLVYTESNETIGIKYGDIVTKNVLTQILVPEDSLPDTGINIISSEVTPIGNGLAIKQTEKLKDENWPDPLSLGVSVPPPSPPNAIYWESMRRETSTSKAGSVPEVISLTGNTVGVEYKKETPDRYEITKVSDFYEINSQTEISKSIEKNAYLERRSFSKASNTESLPDRGSGSSKLVYKAGGLVIYENSYEETSPITGLKGVDTNSQPWGSIIETVNYTTSSTCPPGGSVKLIYNDGMSIVYETTNVSISVTGGSLSSESQPWGVITKTGNYSTTPVTGAGKDSRQVWTNGVQRVFLNETDSVSVNGTTFNYSPQPWGSIIKRGVYQTTPSTGLGQESKQVWSNGVVKVFLNETDEVYASGETKDIDPQQWGKLEWEGTYAKAASGDRSRQVWSNGQTQVYLNENANAIISGTTQSCNSQPWGYVTKKGVYAQAPASGAGVESRQVWSIGSKSVYLNETDQVSVSGVSVSCNAQPWGVLIKNGVYSTAPSTGPGKDSRQIWSNGQTRVYLNETDQVTVSGSNKDVDAFAWGTITWNGSYARSTAQVRSKQVWANGVSQVFLNETPTLKVNTGQFVSAVEKNRLVTETEKTTYSLSPQTNDKNCRSRAIYSINNQNVYENVTITVEPAEKKVYKGVIQYSLPSIVKDIKKIVFPLKNGGSIVHFEPEIQEGMSGSFPCEITEYYTEEPEPPDLSELITFKPKPISFHTPWASLEIGPTLHKYFELTYSTGTEDPKFEYIADVVRIKETDPVTWENKKFLALYNSTPYKNGFIIKEYRIQMNSGI